MHESIKSRLIAVVTACLTGCTQSHPPMVPAESGHVSRQRQDSADRQQGIIQPDGPTASDTVPQSASLMKVALELSQDSDEAAARHAWVNAAKASLEKTPIRGTDAIMGMSPDNLGLMLYEATKAIAAHDEDFLAYTNRGFLLAALSEFALAETDLTRALEVAPDDIQARFFRGVVRLQSGNAREAVLDLDKLVDQGPPAVTPTFYDHANVYFCRALCKLTRPGNHASADADLTAAADHSTFYSKVTKLLNDPTGANSFRVYYDPSTMPSYSAWTLNDRQCLRSIYLFRAVGATRQLVVWEIVFG